MKKLFLIPLAVFLLSACTVKARTLVGDIKESGLKAELTINGDAGHLSIQYPPSSQWKQINEDVKVIKNTSYEITIQRSDNVKLNFVGGKTAPFVCDNCNSTYKYEIPTIWYKKI